MIKPPSNIESLERVIQEADAQLQDVDPSPFSSSAFSVLKDKISEYISQLVSESIKVSKRHQADTVSAAHVERASEYLVTTTSRRFFRHLGTIGGIFLGASLSNILTMTTIELYSAVNIVISLTFGIVGAFMIALHMAKD